MILGIIFYFPSAWAGNSLPSPELENGSTFLSKTALWISHNPRHKQADWVFYPLGREQLEPCVKRSGAFRADPSLPDDEAASPEDYSKSGFDKGHLSPAADNRWTKNAMLESFHLSNVSPQPPRFNQGIWARLENLVRAWGMEGDGLMVTTGPVLKAGLPAIGRGKVSTPEAFYKVLYNPSKEKAIAFLLPTNAQGELSQFSLSVRELENQVGIDFHKNLSSAQQREIEDHLDLDQWNFRDTFQAPPCSAKRQEQRVDLLRFFEIQGSAVGFFQ